MTEAKPEKPKAVYLLRSSDGRTITIGMDSRGYMAHVVIRQLAEKMSHPPEAVSLYLEDPEGKSIELDPNRMLDEQIQRIARVPREKFGQTPIDIRIDEDVIAEQARLAAEPEAGIFHLGFHRQCVVIPNPREADLDSVIRLAQTVGAIRRGGLLWLSHRYLVRIGDGPERYYSRKELHHAMG